MVAHTFAIPVYQESAYLEECVQHLLKQTMRSNIIFTTSTPSAFSREIAERYQIPYHVNPQQNAGIAADWNFALDNATTRLVTITHQDDIYEPEYAEAVINHFERYNQSEPLIIFTDYCDIVRGQVRQVGINAIVKRLLLFPFFLTNRLSNPVVKKMLLYLGSPICCPSVAFNKAALGNFRFSANYQCVLDWRGWYTLSKQTGAFIYINKRLIRHRIHHHSETTRQLQSGRRYQEEVQMFEQIWGKKTGRLLGKIYKLGHADNR